MKTILYWICLILGTIVLGLVIVAPRIDLARTKAAYDTLNLKYQMCLHAPAVITHDIDTVFIRVGNSYHPNPVTESPLPSSLTPSDPDTLLANVITHYDDTCNFPGGFIHWTAQVCGSIDSITFPDIAYPKETIRVTRVVDTCILKPATREHIPMNHFLLYGKIFGSGIKIFPNMDAGMIWTIKDKYGFMGGIMYDVPNNKPYLTLGGMIFIH